MTSMGENSPVHHGCKMAALAGLDRCRRRHEGQRESLTSKEKKVALKHLPKKQDRTQCWGRLSWERWGRKGDLSGSNVCPDPFNPRAAPELKGTPPLLAAVWGLWIAEGVEQARREVLFQLRQGEDPCPSALGTAGSSLADALVWAGVRHGLDGWSETVSTTARRWAPWL